MLLLYISQNSRIDRRHSDKSRNRSSLLEAELTRAHQLLVEERHFDKLSVGNKTNTEDNSKVGITVIKLLNVLKRDF